MLTKRKKDKKRSDFLGKNWTLKDWKSLTWNFYFARKLKGWNKEEEMPKIKTSYPTKKYKEGWKLIPWAGEEIKF